MDKKKMLLTVILISLPLVISEALLPLLFCHLIEWRVGKILDTDEVSVMIKQRPALMLLGGRVDSLDLQANNIRIDNLFVEELHVDLDEADIPLKSLTNNNFINEAIAKKIGIEAVIDADNIRRSIARGMNIDQTLITARIVGDEILINTNAGTALIAKYDNTIRGKLEVVDNALFLKIGTPDKYFLTIPILSKEKLPWKVKIISVKYSDDKIKLLFKNSTYDVRRGKIE